MAWKSSPRVAISHQVFERVHAHAIVILLEHARVLVEDGTNLLDELLTAFGGQHVNTVPVLSE